MQFIKNCWFKIRNMKTKIGMAITMMLLTYAPWITALAEDDNTSPTGGNYELANQDVSYIYTNLIWPFVYLMSALVLLLGMGTFAHCFAKLSANANNPQARKTIYITMYRSFWIMSAAGSIGFVFAVIVSCLS